MWLRMSSLANQVLVGHRGTPLLWDEYNGFPHWELSKSHYDIITHKQDITLLFWYVVGATVINKILKINYNMLPVQGVIATWVKHECIRGKLVAFIMTAGGYWRCSRLSPICTCVPIKTVFPGIWVPIIKIRHLGEPPDSKVHGANMGPIWCWQDPSGPHVGPRTLLSGSSLYWKFLY